jgi:hypothetical protein
LGVKLPVRIVAHYMFMVEYMQNMICPVFFLQSIEH